MFLLLLCNLHNSYTNSILHFLIFISPPNITLLKNNSIRTKIKSM